MYTRKRLKTLPTSPAYGTSAKRTHTSDWVQQRIGGAKVIERPIALEAIVKKKIELSLSSDY